jgi:hypothetical protein
MKASRFISCTLICGLLSGCATFESAQQGRRAGAALSLAVGPFVIISSSVASRNTLSRSDDVRITDQERSDLLERSENISKVAIAGYVISSIGLLTYFVSSIQASQRLYEMNQADFFTLSQDIERSVQTDTSEVVSVDPEVPTVTRVPDQEIDRIVQSACNRGSDQHCAVARSCRSALNSETKRSLESCETLNTLIEHGILSPSDSISAWSGRF